MSRSKSHLIAHFIPLSTESPTEGDYTLIYIHYIPLYYQWILAPADSVHCNSSCVSFFPVILSTKLKTFTHPLSFRHPLSSNYLSVGVDVGRVEVCIFILVQWLKCFQAKMGCYITLKEKTHHILVS